MNNTYNTRLSARLRREREAETLLNFTNIRRDRIQNTNYNNNIHYANYDNYYSNENIDSNIDDMYIINYEYPMNISTNNLNLENNYNLTEENLSTIDQNLQNDLEIITDPSNLDISRYLFELPINREPINQEPINQEPIQQEIKNTKMIDTTECVICMSEKTTCIIVPCGHKCLCSKCSISLRKDYSSKCPICRIEITNSIEVI